MGKVQASGCLKQRYYCSKCFHLFLYKERKSRNLIVESNELDRELCDISTTLEEQTKGQIVEKNFIYPYISLQAVNFKMVVTCSAGDCVAECVEGCICMANADIPHDCFCECTHPHTLPASKKGPYKSRIKVTPQARYNVCLTNASITTLAQSLDKVLPNRILVPANKLTKKVNLSLKE